MPGSWYCTNGALWALVSGERFADRVRFHSVTAEGERWKEYPARGVSAILETGVAHHYLVLLRVLRDLEQTGDPTLDISSYLPDTAAARKLSETLHLETATARKQLLREVTTMGIDMLSGDRT